MPLMNPIYLDLELVQTVAHFQNIEFAVQTQVEEVGHTGANAEAGLAVPGVKAGGSYQAGSEFRQSYTVLANPLKVANDVIVGSANETKDPFTHEVAKGDLVRFDAPLKLSDASEVGNIMARFMPAMAAGGGQITEEMKTEIMSSMFGGGKLATHRQLFVLESGDQEGQDREEGDAEQQMLISIDPSYFFRNNTLEDLEGEVTVFGHVERVIAAGRTESLERWLLPDMDRAARRALKGKGLTQMLQQIQPITPVDVDKAVKVVGPAIEIRPIAVY